MSDKYIHGYSEEEAERLCDQANTLEDFLHSGTIYPAGSKVLEAGCGVGSQTVTLAKNSPTAQFTSIDISQKSVDAAKELTAQNHITNVNFQVADIFNLPFEYESFDHIFVCFVLEHLEFPLRALECLKRVLKKGGTLTVIEGDHGSTYFYPESMEALLTIQCQIELQARLKGNCRIGRQIHPLLMNAGFRRITVTPKMVYVDGSKPDMIEGFTKKTFIAMIEGIKEQAIEKKIINEATWEKGIQDLYRTTSPDGVFCYTFFKGVAVKP